MATTNRNVTAYGRLSYPNLFQPRKVTEESDKEQFSATLLIPKTDTATIQAIQAAIQAAVEDGVNSGKFKVAIDPTQTAYPPLRDGDGTNRNGEPRGAEFADHWFIAAKAPSSRKPFVVDGQLQPVIDPAEIYAGCYVNMAIQFFPYEHKTGGKGISASLVGVQKVKDGEPLGGGIADASEVFSALGGSQAAQPAVSPNLGF